MAGSQIRTVPSSLAVASQVPSGAIATAVTRPVWPVRVARCWPVAGSQIRTVPSPLAVASQVPSGAIATAVTAPVWPVRVARCWPVAASQIRTVPSSPAVASQVPSGAIATAVTSPVWPVRVRRSAGSGRSGSGHLLISAGSLRLAVRAWAWAPQSGSWLTLLYRMSISECGGSVGASRCAACPSTRRSRSARGVPIRARSAYGPAGPDSSSRAPTHRRSAASSSASAGPPGGEQVLDQVLPQVPGLLGQLPPRGDRAVAGRGRRGAGQARRHGVQQDLRAAVPAGRRRALRAGSRG